MDIIKTIASEFNLREGSVEKTIELIDEGNTIPFIARYRKEVTGGMSDVTLRELDERLTYLRGLEERKTEVIRLIEEQGKLTEELKQEIESAQVLQRVEDLYKPYKQKRATRASKAKEQGLEPLAVRILLQEDESGDTAAFAEDYVDAENGVETAAAALQGACDIIAEQIADDADRIEELRQITWDKGRLATEAVDPEEKTVYDMYYDKSEPIRKIPNHRVLAINRGEKEKKLKVKVELVKIDPKHIGVGQYQHDINQKMLDNALAGVVENCVNRVGVDLNTASPSLLSYIAGINSVIAKNIVAWREENGRFRSRRELLKVARLGPKAYEQCAGFLRITGGKEPLDSTSVHPESYEVTRQIMEKVGITGEDIVAGGAAKLDEKIIAAYPVSPKNGRGSGRSAGGSGAGGHGNGGGQRDNRRKWLDSLKNLAREAQAKQKQQDEQNKQNNEARLKDSIAAMAEDMGIGKPTLTDIIAELKKPARDPREDAPPVVFRNDVKSFDDLKEGMELTGTVRNVVDFGAFVDIGVKQDGLVHISQLSRKFVSHPMDVVAVGDTVKVRILSVDKERQKISLTMVL